MIPLLDLSDPYVMRAGVLGVIGEIYIQRLTKMNNADKKVVDMRDKFADILEQHIHDVNGIGTCLAASVTVPACVRGCHDDPAYLPACLYVFGNIALSS